MRKESKREQNLYQEILYSIYMTLKNSFPLLFNSAFLIVSFGNPVFAERERERERERELHPYSQNNIFSGEK